MRPGDPDLNVTEMWDLSAYHMNRSHWLTVTLDGRVDEDTIAFLLEISFDLTRTQKK